MANRYWVGGTADWDGTAGTKWATTSGGAGGAARPNSTDDVFFNAASGSGTISILGTQSCRNLNCTGFTGTLKRKNVGAGDGTDVLQVSSSATAATFVSGMTVNDLVLSFNTGSSVTLTSAGKNFRRVQADSNSALILADELVCTGTISIISSTLTTGGFAVTAPAISFSNATVNLGSSIVTVSGTGTCFSAIGTTTISAGTSTIKLTNNSAVAKTFAGGGLTYNNLWNATGSTGVVTVTGSNTFADLKNDAGRSMYFAAGTTQTVSSFTAVGSPGNPITFRSNAAGTAWNLSKASGTVAVSYVDLKDSHASGGATFDATDNCINSGGNSGWSFGGSTTGAFILNVLFALVVAFPAMLGALAGGPIARQSTSVRKAA